ncbi:hypothetical protein MLD52_14795 [Puniceicoccaceae bacterium K14]|nr:hypothetical protein [Puniceicoccaceae bacterium K14]
MKRRRKFELSGSFLKDMRFLAEKEAPYPWLYFAEILQLDDYEERIHAVNYCFRINNNFAVTFQSQYGKMTPGQLNKWMFQFHYKPISNFNSFLTIEQALECIWVKMRQREFGEELERLTGKFFSKLIKEELGLTYRYAIVKEFEAIYDYLFCSYPIGPYHSCAFYQPFSAEFREPFYFFRIHDSCTEIMVGARSGEVKTRRNEPIANNNNGGGY